MVDEVLGLFRAGSRAARTRSWWTRRWAAAATPAALLDAHPGLALIGVDTDAQAIEESRACSRRTPAG